eukprot:6455838-Amphidinium_carterae.1
MEFVQGGDFLYHLCQKEVLPAKDTAFYMAELLEALDTLHQLGLVHRDVKPDNMVLDTAGHLKLLDFGLCKDTSAFEEPNTGGIKPTEQPMPSKSLALLPLDAIQRPAGGHLRLKTQVGTYEYMAPEVLDSSYGKEVDLWALGIITFECINGFNMFHRSDETEGQVLDGVRNYRKLLDHWCKKIKDSNRKRQEKGKTPLDFNADVEFFVRGLVCDVSKRLSASQCRKHAFFKGGLCYRKLPLHPNIEERSTSSRSG